MVDPLDLGAIRQQIDTVDEQILHWLTQRGQLAQQVALAKRQTGEQTAFYRPEREAEVLRRVVALNPGPLPPAAIAVIFREIMSACLNLQNPLRVAYLGPVGTFTEAAALKQFGQAVATLPLVDITAVFRAVEVGDADYGVVPVENSTAGVVHHTLDQFMQSPLKICGEVELQVHHQLMSQETQLNHIRVLYSHPQAFAQCQHWLDYHPQLRHVPRIAVGSNAEAAQRAALEPHSAAIAGEMASRHYQLAILAHNIEDNADNATRFLVIGQQCVPPSGQDKTSLIVAARNKPGALYQLLSPLAENQISMTRIESRPSQRGQWEYVFFIDIEGHQNTPVIQNALQQLETTAAWMKILGSYPCAVL